MRIPPSTDPHWPTKIRIFWTAMRRDRSGFLQNIFNRLTRFVDMESTTQSCSWAPQDCDLMARSAGIIPRPGLWRVWLPNGPGH